MSDFQIQDSDLPRSKFEGKIAIVTGGSSGIGLATTTLLTTLGCTVYSADIQPPPTPNASTHIPTNVSQWASLTALFKTVHTAHGRLDFVFANAGIGPRANYLELQTDEKGELMEPNRETLDVNLNSVVNTASLAVHYMKTQKTSGSIVLMGSSTGLHAVRAVDYSTAKSGVLSLGRSLSLLLSTTPSTSHIRVNTLAPSWTDTQVLPDLGNLLKAVDAEAQSSEVVARAAVLLMGDEGRNGEVLFVAKGRCREIEKSVLRGAYDDVKGGGESDDEVLKRIFALGG